MSSGWWQMEALLVARAFLHDPSGVSLQVMSRKGPVPEIQGVEVALAPEELELDPMAMTQKYEEHVREQQAQVEKEDFSDMVAEHAAKQKVRRFSNLMYVQSPLSPVSIDSRPMAVMEC